jgi:hypothetical protein
LRVDAPSDASGVSGRSLTGCVTQARIFFTRRDIRRILDDAGILHAHA